MYWSFSFSISSSNEHPGLISFRMDWLDLLAVQGTLKSLLQHHISKASIFRCSGVRKHFWKYFVKIYNFNLFMLVIFFCVLTILGKGLKTVILRKHDFDQVTPLLRFLPSLPIAVESSPNPLSRVTRPSMSGLCLPLCPLQCPALHPTAIPVMHFPTPGPSWTPAHAVLSAGTCFSRASQTPTQR